MKFKWIAGLVVAMGLGMAVPTVVRADEDERVVSIDDIPAPARTALLREAKGAPIRRVEVETEHGKTVYEGVILQGNDEVGITVDAKGNVLGRHLEKKEGK